MMGITGYYGWIAAGRTPYVFMHSPYDLYTPQLGREFHRLLSERLYAGDLPPWPGEASPPERRNDVGQLALF